MNRYLVPATGLAVLVGLAGDASAASPAYCALYAREFTLEYIRKKPLDAPAQRWLQDRAFYRCLNLDEQPALPEASAYSEVDGASAALPEIAAPMPPSKPPIPAAAAKPVKVASARTGRGHGSGLKPWTAKWKAWCAEHFPRSFNPKTGYVLPLDGPKTFCK